MCNSDFLIDLLKIKLITNINEGYINIGLQKYLTK